MHFSITWAYLVIKHIFMEEQELYDELEFIKDEMKNGEIDVELATNKLEEILTKLEELIESKLDNLTEDYDQLDLYEDN
tara:strand:- start:236 stop:472 length:237 start_codon:yes stop_codon:yes gene_type:complete